MGSYNIKSIKRKVTKSNAFSKASHKKVNAHLHRARTNLINEFDNHPVTKEISSGSNGSNLSKTLAGYGNLFSYIGFHGTSDPIASVRNLLFTIPQIKSKKLKSGSMEFVLSAPKLEDFRMVAKMPWEGGRSWVEGIESGISGFSYYMANMFGENIKSRSGSAIQSKSKVRVGVFRPTPYLSVMISNFERMILKV